MTKFCKKNHLFLWSYLSLIISKCILLNSSFWGVDRNKWDVFLCLEEGRDTTLSKIGHLFCLCHQDLCHKQPRAPLLETYSFHRDARSLICYFDCLWHFWQLYLGPVTFYSLSLISPHLHTRLQKHFTTLVSRTYFKLCLNFMFQGRAIKLICFLD